MGLPLVSDGILSIDIVLGFKKDSVQFGGLAEASEKARDLKLTRQTI